MKIKNRKFFERSAAEVAKDLLGKIIVRNVNGKVLRARILEVEAYFDESDPASWARLGKRKDNFVMWEKPGLVLVKNVHKYFMLNFVVNSVGVAGAVLIRGVRPLNFEARVNGPGLLSLALEVNKDLNGEDAVISDKIWIEDDGFVVSDEDVFRSKRIGVVGDLEGEYRYWVKNMD